MATRIMKKVVACGNLQATTFYNLYCLIAKIFLQFGSDVFREVCEAHVATLCECVVKSESGAKIERDVSCLGEFKVIPEEFLVVGMHTVLDYAARTLVRVFVSEVGHALLSHDHLHAMLAVVDVSDHRHDCRKRSPFLDRGAKEDREIAVAGKVAGSADSVHHVAAVDVGRVDVAENVAFESGVHSDKAYSAHHLRMV